MFWFWICIFWTRKPNNLCWLLFQASGGPLMTDLFSYKTCVNSPPSFSPGCMTDLTVNIGERATFNCQVSIMFDHFPHVLKKLQSRIFFDREFKLHKCFPSTSFGHVLLAGNSGPSLLMLLHQDAMLLDLLLTSVKIKNDLKGSVLRRFCRMVSNF